MRFTTRGKRILSPKGAKGQRRTRANANKLTRETRRKTYNGTHYHRVKLEPHRELFCQLYRDQPFLSLNDTVAALSEHGVSVCKRTVHKYFWEMVIARQIDIQTSRSRRCVGLPADAIDAWRRRVAVTVKIHPRRRILHSPGPQPRPHILPGRTPAERMCSLLAPIVRMSAKVEKRRSHHLRYKLVNGRKYLLVSRLDSHGRLTHGTLIDGTAKSAIWDRPGPRPILDRYRPWIAMVCVKFNIVTPTRLRRYLHVCGLNVSVDTCWRYLQRLKADAEAQLPLTPDETIAWLHVLRKAPNAPIKQGKTTPFG